MRILSVIHIIGFLLMFLAGAMLIPLPFSLYYQDNDIMALLIGAAVTFAFGFASWLATRARFNRDLRPKELAKKVTKATKGISGRKTN